MSQVMNAAELHFNKQLTSKYTFCSDFNGFYTNVSESIIVLSFIFVFSVQVFFYNRMLFVS